MNRQDLEKLRNEITLNSLYISDYENSFGIDEKVVCMFMEGYFEELCNLLKEQVGDEEYDKMHDNEFFDRVFKLDTIDNLENYYNSVENIGF